MNLMLKKKLVELLNEPNISRELDSLEVVIVQSYIGECFKSHPAKYPNFKTIEEWCIWADQYL